MSLDENVAVKQNVFGHYVYFATRVWNLGTCKEYFGRVQSLGTTAKPAYISDHTEISQLLPIQNVSRRCTRVL